MQPLPANCDNRSLEDNMHIAFVVAGLGAGGVEKVIGLIAHAWVTKGRTVTIIAFDAEDAPIFHRLDSGIRLVRLGIAAGGGGLAGLLAVTKRCRVLRRELDKLKPDVTLSFLTKINVLTLLASLGSRRRVVISERNNPRLQQANRLWTFVLARLCWRANAIVMQTVASLECLGRAARARARVIPNPIVINPATQPRKRPPVFAAVGRLAWQKGFDLLIAAFAMIADDHADWTLVIWGEGECRAELEQQIAAAGLEGRIKMPGNSRSPEDWVGQADAFVMSSRFEGFGNALGEAMAAGLPAISFDCAYGPGEIIRQEHDGLLVPNGDVPALALAMSRLMADPALRSRLGSAARAVGERFHPERIVEGWEGVVQDLAAR